MVGSKNMKKLLAIIVLSLCFITPSQADDIKDFQIEGISIGDSLLDVMSVNEIKQNIIPYQKRKKKILCSWDEFYIKI